MDLVELAGSGNVKRCCNEEEGLDLRSRSEKNPNRFEREAEKEPERAKCIQFQMP